MLITLAFALTTAVRSALVFLIPLPCVDFPPYFQFASAMSSVIERQGLAERQTSVSDLPPGWRFLGCFTSVSSLSQLFRLYISHSRCLAFRDSVAARTLSGASLSDASSMTIESCVSLCVSKGFAYAGLEFGHECCAYHDSKSYYIYIYLFIVCDNAFNDIFPLPVSSSQCTLPCAGNTNQICGAADRLSVYFSGVLPRFPAPATPPTGWKSSGCFR